MARFTKSQCSSMELNGLIQVIQDAPLVESESKGIGKVVERSGSTRITGGMAC
jgi:hypothetical protein